MSKVFSHTIGYVVYDEDTLTNNPSKQYGNWKRGNYNIPVDKPAGPQELVIPAGGTVTPFSGVKTITHASAEFTLSVNPVKPSTYRLSWTGVGTFSGFRTTRDIDFSGQEVTLTVNNNAIVELSSTVDVSDAQVGDTVFIPGTMTGDSASPFSDPNVGYWVVSSVLSSTSLALTRPPCNTFNGLSETVTVQNPEELAVYSSGPVVVGDQLEINSGFSPVTWGDKQITALSWNWVEFVSTTPLPLESDVSLAPDAFSIFGSAKRWVRIETDSPIALKFNGSAESVLKVIPRDAITGGLVGWFDSWGLFWELEIENLNKMGSCRVTISSVE